jgi:hypothetical protein
MQGRKAETRFNTFKFLHDLGGIVLWIDANGLWLWLPF